MDENLEKRTDLTYNKTAKAIYSKINTYKNITEGFINIKTPNQCSYTTKFVYQ